MSVIASQMMWPPKTKLNLQTVDTLAHASSLPRTYALVYYVSRSKKLFLRPLLFSFGAFVFLFLGFAAPLWLFTRRPRLQCHYWTYNPADRSWPKLWDLTFSDQSDPLISTCSRKYFYRHVIHHEESMWILNDSSFIILNDWPIIIFLVLNLRVEAVYI